MRPPSTRSMSQSIGLNGLLFVALNMADAWLTGELIARGWWEINPIVIPYGSDMLIKGALALAIVLSLMAVGKDRLLIPLNVCMLVVVLWLGSGLLASV